MRRFTWGRLLTVICVHATVRQGYSDINVSSDLNCDFSSDCRWRNSTEDSGDWIISSHVEMDGERSIIPMKEDENDNFIYTGGFMGRTVAILVSDVLTCQLGGANIKYWYYRTGYQSQLDICIRQPPGNREPTGLRCYDGLSSTNGQSWILRVVELPPISQPFEILFRAVYYPPNDVIAMDDIVYEASLCVHGRNGSSGETGARDVRNTRSAVGLPLIGYRDWQLLRESEHFRGQTMIVVSQGIDVTAPDNTKVSHDHVTTTEVPTTSTLEDTTLIYTSTFPSTTTTSTTTTTTTTLSTTTTVTTTTTTTPSETTTTPLETTTTATTTTVPPPIVESQSSTLLPLLTQVDIQRQLDLLKAKQEDPVDNFVKFLRQAAPVLPYIPTLVKSLQSVDSVFGAAPAVAAASFPLEIRRKPVPASHFYNTEDYGSTVSPTLVQLAKKFGLMEPSVEQPPVVSLPTQSPPQQPQPLLSIPSNVYGVQTSTLRAVEITPTVYPINLIRSHRKDINTQKIAKMTSSTQPPEEYSHLQNLHSQIFKNIQTTTPLIVFQKPTKTESDVANKLTELASLLPDGALEDMASLNEIPDLEGLTKGMDLSLIKKPGGFAKLKKQFVDRLMRRTLGLSVEEKPLPPAIVPFKVTRKMMKERRRRRKMKLLA